MCACILHPIWPGILLEFSPLLVITIAWLCHPGIEGNSPFSAYHPSEVTRGWRPRRLTFDEQQRLYQPGTPRLVRQRYSRVIPPGRCPARYKKNARSRAVEVRRIWLFVDLAGPCCGLYSKRSFSVLIHTIRAISPAPITLPRGQMLFTTIYPGDTPWYPPDLAQRGCHGPYDRDNPQSPGVSQSPDHKSTEPSRPPACTTITALPMPAPGHARRLTKTLPKDRFPWRAFLWLPRTPEREARKRTRR